MRFGSIAQLDALSRLKHNRIRSTLKRVGRDPTRIPLTKNGASIDADQGLRFMMQKVTRAFSEPFRIACWPGCGNMNPYQRLFYNALKFHAVGYLGIAVIDTRWLKNNAHELDAIHFHWPEDLWRAHGTGTVGAAWKVIGLWRFLRLAKRLGLKRIWTIHNLEHHEGVDRIDLVGYRTLARESDLLICHSHCAANALRQRDRPAGRVVMMPHGNYDGIYPSPRPRDIVLLELGLNPERPVVCCVGLIRHYKGVDIAVDAMRSLSGQIQIIIGGLPYLYDSGALINSLANLNGAALVNHWLSEQEFADIVEASEAVLLPYREITGSGALLAAWTLGRGVVASDLPYFREVSKPEADAAQFFPVENSSALASAIQKYIRIPFKVRYQAARRLADHYRWQRCVESVAQVLVEWRTRSGEVWKTN